jgi:hypothetical protein
MGCCDPQPVSASVASVFLAAASRACGDAETAERLEKAVDAKYLRREGGLIWLDVNREWRIGATAMRIISLAESRGSRFREMKKVDGSFVGPVPKLSCSCLIVYLKFTVSRHLTNAVP